MKPSKTKQTRKSRFALLERKFPERRVIGFPQMQGRTIEKIEFFTAADYHCVSIKFEDKTLLTLSIEPCFLLAAEFSDRKRDSLRIIKEWPAIHSKTERK